MIMEWRDRYELEARRVADALGGMGEASLIRRIRAGRLDPYFAIWRAVGEVGTPEGAGPTLWTFLRDRPGESWMLHRYHCAAALFRVLGRDGPASANPLRARVQWDHEGEEARQEALLELKTLLDDASAIAGGDAPSHAEPAASPAAKGDGEHRVRVFIRYIVKDFAMWKAAYDAFDEERKAMGVVGDAVYREILDPNVVTAWHDFKDIAAARAFAESGGLRAVLRETGVFEEPTVWFTTPA